MRVVEHINRSPSTIGLFFFNHNFPNSMAICQVATPNALQGSCTICINFHKCIVQQISSVSVISKERLYPERADTGGQLSFGSSQESHVLVCVCPNTTWDSQAMKTDYIFKVCFFPGTNPEYYTSSFAPREWQALLGFKPYICWRLCENLFLSPGFRHGCALRT